MIKKSVTIGIPAYNEEENITFLLGDIQSQSRNNWILDQIIVYSDGSTDKTVELIKKQNIGKINIIQSKYRKGVSYGQNLIMRKTKSDILFLLNADITIKNKKLFDKIIPKFDEDTGLVSIRVTPVKATTFFERVINWSHSVKYLSYEALSLDNIYLCHGRFRAMSYKLYKKMVFPKVIAEDAFSYLICKKYNLKFKYLKSLKIMFRSPTNINDHIKQSKRFLNGARELMKLYGVKKIKNEYNLKNLGSLSVWLKSVIMNPVYFVLYLLIFSYSVITLKLGTNFGSYIWSISDSSKKIYAKKR
jgi:glycosyltransferase involved in cell wall biosynthesis